MSETPVKWDPACLSFQIALGKPAVQNLVGTNEDKDAAYTYKVKTTNPRRYSVRPNVGIAWPGSTSSVTVQLPAMKELPPDMGKCKDKFQVLTLKLDPAQAAELKAMAVENQRAELTKIWSSDGAKDACVEKIRCNFALDASERDAPIPEEEHPIAPYSPEVGAAAGGAAASQTPAAQTPFVDGGEGKPPSLTTQHSSGVYHESPEPTTSSPAKQQLDGALEAAALKDQLEEARRGMAAQKSKADTSAARVASLEKELKEAAKLAKAGGGGGGGGVSPVMLLAVLLLGLVAGLGLGRGPLSPACPAVAPNAHGGKGGMRKPDEL